MSESQFVVRVATPDDADVIARIHNQGISERIATFETVPRTVAQVRQSLTEKASTFPAVVVEKDGVVIGWAAAGAYRGRPCYHGIAEHSVYVDQASRNMGAGRAALQGLVLVYQQLGFWKLVSRIFPENTASLALHEALGFRVVGVYHQHAQLDGEWKDCVIVEKLLRAADRRP